MASEINTATRFNERLDDVGLAVLASVEKGSHASNTVSNVEFRSCTDQAVCDVGMTTNSRFD